MTQIPDFDLLLTFGGMKVNVVNYSTKSMDHLGLVAVLCKEIGIAEFIDERLPKQPAQFHITHGQLLVAMILNGLGFVSRTLHMVPDYFSDLFICKHAAGTPMIARALRNWLNLTSLA